MQINKPLEKMSPLTHIYIPHISADMQKELMTVVSNPQLLSMPHLLGHNMVLSVIVHKQNWTAAGHALVKMRTSLREKLITENMPPVLIYGIKGKQLASHKSNVYEQNKVQKYSILSWAGIVFWAFEFRGLKSNIVLVRIVGIGPLIPLMANLSIKINGAYYGTPHQ